MNIVLLGCPGAGKGTQAPALTEKYTLKHMSTGDIFRAEISAKSPLGQKVEAIIKAGQLVPDDVVLEVVASKIKTEKGGLLFDGFPRTLEQARGLDKALDALGRKIDAVVFIDLTEQEVLGRLTARRSCASCKHVYNLNTNPPKSADKCDKCGGGLVWRDDDKPETIKARLKVYRDQTQPLVEYYKTRTKFVTVNGAQQPKNVSEEIFSSLPMAKAGI